MSESYQARVVRMSTERGDFVMGEDGYYVFWPTGSNRGALTPRDLRILADELDRLNAPWDEIVQNDPSISGKPQEAQP